MKIGQSTRHVATWALLIGLALRAATPIGYMPAASGSGFLFELCPHQLPAGLTLPGADDSHSHHHSHEGVSSTDSDGCQLGHMLSSAAAVGDFSSIEPATFPATRLATPTVLPVPSAARFELRSRGPPA